MVEFGKKLTHRKIDIWENFYLDYDGLKSILTQAQDESCNASHASALSTESKLHPVTLDFLTHLRMELEKIILFFLEEQGKIALALNQNREDLWKAHEVVEYEMVYQHFQDTGLCLLRLVQFLDLNLNGLRKILKKHDKIMQANLSRSFWKGGKLASSKLATPLLQLDESVGALVYILETCLIELQNLSDGPAPLEAGLKTQPLTLRKTSQMASNPSLSADWKQGRTHGRSLSFAAQHDSFASLGAISPKPRIVGSDMIILRIQAARSRLKESSEFISMLAAPLMIMEGTSDDASTHSIEAEIEEKKPSQFSNFLNLMSTFLYMTNYYIVAPTSGSYASKLDAEPSLASIIIGMTPVAALVSTVLFSWWTNHSYKSALLFASGCSLVGNLLYALGLPCNSLALVMIGRLLNGFGSARSINRRYIADSFSRAERTSASATFVTAGSLGMAAGPAIASLLHVVTPSSKMPGGSPYWQVENAPGWFMMVMWSFFLGAMIFFFQDPPKKVQAPTIPPPPYPSESGEKRPLIPKGDNGVSSPKKESILRNVPVMITLFVYFVLKLLLEATLSSCATITRFYFGWDGRLAGLYLACLGLLMLPANLLVSYLARRFDDRELIIGLQAFMVAGCVGIIQYRPDYRLPQYLVASLVLFASANALEGPNMSLLSKTIPSSWSRGLFNVGMLATESGTAGRAVSDVLISIFGSKGLEYLLNFTFGSFALLSFGTFALSVSSYAKLVPKDKDD